MQPNIQPAIIPRVAVRFEGGSLPSAPDVKRTLWDGDPAISVEAVKGELWINTHTLTISEAEIIVRCIKEIIPP
jgi:hypothetical protein